MANTQNLKPVQSKEEARERGRNGGIRSGEVRREKATMIATLKKLLEEKNNRGQTYRELTTLGLIKGAINGNVSNYRTILELVGELNENEFNEEEHKVIVEVVNNSHLEEALYDENNKTTK